MENQETVNEKSYDISFFKPTTELARSNRNLAIGLLLVWMISIFGFHIWLRIIETPTPEKAYTQYEMVWDNIKLGQATVSEKQIYIKSALSVLGKVTLDKESRIFLNTSVNKITEELVPENEKSDFKNKIAAFKLKKFGEDQYQELKKDLGSSAAKYIGVEDYSLEAKLIPLELVAAESYNMDYDNIALVMAKYLIHNQSYLTDFTFLGFPFHYFYTAVFLLVLFVGLCLYYCIAIQKIINRLGIEE
ncbi:MAG: hypothetical protein KAG64_07595 [Bacteroidales bacterium]|nr:hypothetical protein [Bacteroidales bacterium]